MMPLRSMRKRLMVQLPVDSACSKPVVMICVDRCFAQSNCRANHTQSACVMLQPAPACVTAALQCRPRMNQSRPRQWH